MNITLEEIVEFIPDIIIKHEAITIFKFLNIFFILASLHVKKPAYADLLNIILILPS